jgi:hypothetical protein
VWKSALGKGGLAVADVRLCLRQDFFSVALEVGGHGRLPVPALQVVEVVRVGIPAFTLSVAEVGSSGVPHDGRLVLVRPDR